MCESQVEFVYQFQNNSWLILTSEKWCLPWEHWMYLNHMLSLFLYELRRKADSLFNIQDGHSYGGRVVTMWEAEVILLKVNDSLYVCVCMSVCMWSVMSDPLWHHELYSAQLLCPWYFPGKNIGGGCHFLLHGIQPASPALAGGFTRTLQNAPSAVT